MSSQHSFFSIKTLAIGGCLLISVVAGLLFWRRERKEQQEERRQEVARTPVDNRPTIDSRVSYSSQMSEQPPEKQIYRESIKDDWQYQVVPNSLTPPARVSHLHYKILMNLNKGLTYEGSVTMSFSLTGGRDKPLDICFNGDEILHVSVNGFVIPEEEVEYSVQRIRIRPEYLESTNKIQVIFTNKYSFFDDGMCTYFKINEDNKYSLKEQCIFSRNNRLNAPRIMPCLNQRTQCRVELQVIHPQNFQAVSNSQKQLIKLIGNNDLSEYRFFMEDAGLADSGLNSSFASRTSTRSVKSKIKYCTRFKSIHLQSIQQLFISCLPVTQAKCKHTLSSILRFYCRKDVMKPASEFIPQLLNQLEQIELNIGRGRFYTKKVDVVFLKSRTMNGYFTRGVIIIDEDLLEKPLRPKTVYLILRGLLGMDLYRQKVSEFQKLNNDTTQAYPQIRNYLGLRQIKYQRIREFNPKPDFVDYFMEIFHIEMRYISDVQPDHNTKEWIQHLTKGSNYDFWQYFVNHYEFADNSIRDLVVKLALKTRGAPDNQTLLARARSQLAESRYLLHFLKDDEIEANLQKMIRNCPKGLRDRLPKIDLPEHSQLLLPDDLIRYVKIRENEEECQQLYQQFSNFDDRKNFHHVSIIQNQIYRIKSFRRVDTLQVDCKWSLNATKTLRKLDIRNKIDPILKQMINLHYDINA